MLSFWYFSLPLKLVVGEISIAFSVIIFKYFLLIFSATVLVQFELARNVPNQMVKNSSIPRARFRIVGPEVASVFWAKSS